MKSEWKIEYYKSRRGDEPVLKFIESLPVRSQTKIKATLKLFEELGIQMGFPHVKKITGTPLWELRVLGESAVRIFYVAKIDRVFWLLHGFIKKTQKTPDRELRIALKRARET